MLTSPPVNSFSTDPLCVKQTEALPASCSEVVIGLRIPETGMSMFTIHIYQKIVATSTIRWSKYSLMETSQQHVQGGLLAD